MKIVFTRHASIDKIKMLEKHNFKPKITKNMIQAVIRKPEHEDLKSDFPKIIASRSLDEKHVLRVVYKIRML